MAADGGAATALAFGFQPDVVVGDLDSIDAPVLADLRQRGVPIETHPRDKDATDGQLAIERALVVQPASLWLLGFLGGPRLDQALANVLFLVRVGTPTLLLDAHNECTLLLPGAEHAWSTEPGEVVSLIPLTNDVAGIRTQGLRWPARWRAPPTGRHPRHQQRAHRGVKGQGQGFPVARRMSKRLDRTRITAPLP